MVVKMKKNMVSLATAERTMTKRILGEACVHQASCSFKNYKGPGGGGGGCQG